MLKPFENISNRKLRVFEQLFFEKDNFQEDIGVVPNLSISLLGDYKSDEIFKIHLIQISNEQTLPKDFYNMAVNFKKAARELAEFSIEGEDIGKLDTVFFTITYTYRQSLELLLKAIAFKIIDDRTKRINFLDKVGHDLKCIFDEIEAYLENDETSEIIWLKAFLSGISQVDRASDSFRYPFKIRWCSLFKRYEFEHVFKERKDICLEKLVNKLELAFELLKELYDLKESCENEEVKQIDEYSTIFLEEVGDYYSKSVIGYKYNRSEIYIYASAYERSADHLYKVALESVQTSSKSLLAATFYYPICYLYRNALELQLKNLCFLVLNNREALAVIGSKKHNLLGLWNRIHEKYYSSVGINLPIGYQKEIEKILTIIHEADASSSKFRYPVDKDLNYYYQNETRVHLAFDLYSLKHGIQLIESLVYNTQEYIDNREDY